jgi:hypothetical protein
MANHRTTILLDDESRRAAKEAAARLDVTPSEAIRRAILAFRDQLSGVDAPARQRRVRAFKRAAALFEGNDAAAEVAELKRQDAFF